MHDHDRMPMPAHDQTSETDGQRTEHAGMQMGSDVTRPQLAVMTLASLLALIAGLIFSASYANLSISAPQVEGAVMPPG